MLSLNPCAPPSNAVIVRKHMLNNKQAERDDPKQRMQLAREIRISFHNLCVLLSKLWNYIRQTSPKPFSIVPPGVPYGRQYISLTNLDHNSHHTPFPLIMELLNIH